MIQKRILSRDRVRHPPQTGWSWVDRRFVREQADRLSRDALLNRRQRGELGDVVGAEVNQ